MQILSGLFLSLGITGCFNLASSEKVAERCVEANVKKAPTSYALIFFNNENQAYDVWGNASKLNLERYDYLPQGAAMSPNGEWLALHTTKPDEQVLWVLSADGQVQSTDWDKIWFDEFEWLNNNQIILRDRDHTIYILDPFTDQIKTLELSLPDFLSDPVPTPLWPYFRYIVPSPDIERAAYLRNSAEGITNDGLSLWDVQRNLIIWNRFSSDALRVRPEWSSDSQHLAVAWNNSKTVGEYHYEVSIIDRIGEETQITDLSKYFTQVAIWRLSWSPNQHFLAMWLDIPEQGKEIGEPKLFLLNLQTHQLVNLCVQGPFDGTSPIVWSPDSKYLTFESKHVTVVNITDFTSTVLPSGQVIGWMKSK